MKWSEATRKSFDKAAMLLVVWSAGVLIASLPARTLAAPPATSPCGGAPGICDSDVGLGFLMPYLNTHAAHVAIGLGILVSGLGWAFSHDGTRTHKVSLLALGALCGLAVTALMVLLIPAT